jgi:hypothetical protein
VPRPSALLRATVEFTLGTLQARELIIIKSGMEAQLLDYCSQRLADKALGSQLVESLVEAIVSNEAVEELFASNEEIRDIITEFGGALNAEYSAN